VIDILMIAVGMMLPLVILPLACFALCEMFPPTPKKPPEGP
tara:strand:- start:114 stop:236 length:123 start_codon:yes stop_codon:yes gene_type:complete